MAMLLIDAGNSRVKFGLRRDVAYSPRSAPREPGQAAFAYDDQAGMTSWMESLAHPPGVALGTNVAGTAVQHALEQWLSRWSCKVVWTGSGASRLGLTNGYRNPGQLGADRWLGLVGIWACARREGASSAVPHLLAHFGTATTLDSIDSTGRFEGGLILPGRDLMRRSLASGTANLPAADGAIAAFPDHTHDAIVSGVAAAQAGAVVRQWLACRDRHGRAPVLHASGGAWLAIEAEVRHVLAAIGSTQLIRVVDNPVLDGLACVAEAEPDIFTGRP